MKKTAFGVLSLVLLLGAAECSFLSTQEYKEVAFYDLSAEKNLPRITSVPVEFRSFTDGTGNGVRFLIREPGGRVRLDSYNCFSAPPAQLIRRRLVELFPAAFSDDSVKISAILNRFECDRQKGVALMAVDYQLSCNKQKKALRHQIEVKIPVFDGPGIAAALERSVILSAQRLAGEVTAFRKQCAAIKEKK